MRRNATAGWVSSKLHGQDDQLFPKVIERKLSTLGLTEHDLIYRSETASTNIDVMTHFDNSGRLSVAVSESQTAGRGRRGRQWLSPGGKNIYCTIAYVTSVDASSLGLLSILSGIALCRAIHVCGVDGVQLKWPNDLVFDNGRQKQKLGGILIESRPHDHGFFIAVGFGLNVHMDREELDAIGQPATSLDLVVGKRLDRTEILLVAIESIIDNLAEFGEAGIDHLIDSFSRYDAYRNQSVCVINADEQIHGISRGINRQGQLLLDSGDKQLSFAAAEISLRAG